MALSSTHSKPKLNVVWFKRDLRVFDHAPLAQAASCGDVLPLFVVEPDFWRLPDTSARQWDFVRESLQVLRADLAALGQPLVVTQGDVVKSLSQIAQVFEIEALYSHEETGNGWTFARDQRVKAWCRSENILWHETPQHGVQRRLKSRDGWARAWDAQMSQPMKSAPLIKPLDEIDLGKIPEPRDLGVAPDPCPERQNGGRKVGLKTLHSFLYERGKYYRSDMSNPRKGALSCSRISPYLAWGCLSMREISHAAQRRREELRLQGVRGPWNGALSSFTGRLHWHCHFIQKLEDEPRLEFENLHKAYDDLRPKNPDRARLEAWKAGETGLPFVDACMRSLRATGWLNFRMRAMLMAVASYHLWLDWRAPGEHLARSFTDYEPGIHWPQVQMQSGTTGINAIRIYNPVKQGYDQDPTGAFTRRWVPELSSISDQHLHAPWMSERAGQVLGKTYPFPMVDHLTAAKEAREKIWAVRKENGYSSKAKAISAKHGSRRSGIKMRGQSHRRKAPDARQLGFCFQNSGYNASPNRK